MENNLNEEFVYEEIFHVFYVLDYKHSLYEEVVNDDV